MPVGDTIETLATRLMKSVAASEALTRAQLIDGRLAAAGWKVVPFVPGAPLSSYDRCAWLSLRPGMDPRIMRCV
jgi:hypothetical protein